MSERVDASRSLRRSPRSVRGTQRVRVSVSVSEFEKAMLEEKALACGVSMSRLLVDAALYPRVNEVLDGEAIHELLPLLKDLQLQLRGEATNLNQLVHHANATQIFPVEAGEVAREVQALAREIKDVLRAVTR